jgi:hypothetical protein
LVSGFEQKLFVFFQNKTKTSRIRKLSAPFSNFVSLSCGPGVLSVGSSCKALALAVALFILKENIHLGVYSLAATRLFWRFKYLLLWSEWHFIIKFICKIN